MDDDKQDNRPSSPKWRRRVILLTGMSGAGLSTALKALEDSGYEAVDNLRLGLVPKLIEDNDVAPPALAISIDTRNANFSVDDLLRISQELDAQDDIDVKLVFLDCSDETLQRRFTETRRRHPLAVDRPVTDGIKREREMLWRLRNEADHVIDTSLLSIHDLRRTIVGNYCLECTSELTLFITSFAYRQGIPREADIVFDVRFLLNPHWDTKLRPLTGLDEEVGAYIAKDPDYETFMKHLENLLVPLLGRYQKEGKSYLTIAIGCSGGRHRSVFVAEQLAKILGGHDYIVGLGHRDLDRAANKP